MHQTAKKALAFLLTLCLILGVLPAGAQAALLEGADYITQQLSLGENLVLHLRGNVPEDYIDSATATVIYGDKTDSYKISEMTPDEDGLYDLPIEMAVAQMTDEINLILKAKYLGMDVEAINEVYSIQNYLMTLLEGNYSQMTKDLCLELLNMGSRAQEYFGYNTDNLADAGNTITPANTVPAESPAMNVTGSVDGITFYGTSVCFLSQTSVRFYFKADGAVDGYTFTVDGTECAPVAKDGLYYIETPGINPQNMSNEIAVNVTDGTGMLSVGYAPMWYFIRSYNKASNDTTKNLMAAAYSYYKEAEEYTTKICMDVEITTLGNSTEEIELGFFPSDFEGDINNCTDKIAVKAGTTTTITLEQGKYLVDGELSGIGFAVFGGPTWDAVLGDGTTADRHTIKISNMRLEGAEERSIDMSNATIAEGQTGTGYTNANDFGTASVVDGAIVITEGVCYDAYKITLNEIRTWLSLDMLITTLGNSTGSIDVGFYPHSFEGDINNMVDRVTVTAGTTSTVKLDMEKYLVEGEIPGIGFAIFGGPTWDAKLEDGYTPDRHTITVSNMHLEGEQEQSFDLSTAAVTSGADAGYTTGQGNGVGSAVDGTIVITDGFCYDAHKITLDAVENPEPTDPEPTDPEPTDPEPTDPEPSTYICVDMLITTLGNSTDPIDVGFFPNNFEGDINNYTDKIAVTAGEQTTVKLDLDDYLVDGALPGIGFAIFGGPEWDAKLEDGYTPDRHTITISDVRLEGEQSAVYDLSKSVWTSAANAGYTNANGSGVAEIGSSIVITGGYRYDGHKITLVEDSCTDIYLDVLITTLGNSTDAIDVGFFPNNFEGDINNYTDKIPVTAGTKTTVKLDLDDYLVNGELPGIGFAIFGGPEWNTQISDGVYDRHTITISGVRLEGEQSAVYDLSKSEWTSAANAGYTNANGSGVAEIGSSIVITGGYRYDGHKITLVEDSCTDIYLDVLITTLGNSTDAIDVGFYPNNFEGDINNYTDKIPVTAGTKTTVKLDLDDYLVDGELPGIGFAIFGGPAWDAKLEDGYTPDRHTITISGVRLEGAQSKRYDLSKSEWTSAANAGYTNANGSGVAEIGSSIVITGGYCYDGHKITLVEDTNTYICVDMLITTLGNSTDAIDVGFYPHSFEGDINNYTDKIAVTAGTTTTVRLKQDNYLVDGELPGIGFAIFGGPAWDAKLEDGYTPDRHTITISGMRLEGPEKQTFELSTAAVASGQSGTGYTNANGSGQASVGDTIVITGGFQYDGHKITLNARTVICMDMQIDTLGGNWTDEIEIGFFPSNFEGDINNCTDKIAVKAGEQTTIKLDLEKYLVDGKFSGLGFAIFGGPEWNTQISDGVYDRTTITISGVRLIGAQSQTYDLSNVTWTRGSEAGYTNGNLNGVVTIADGIVVITDGFRYDAHKFTFNT